MTRGEAAKLVLLLIEAYPGSKSSARTSEVYETMLADLDAGIAAQAVRRLIATAKWLPTVAEVRSTYADLAHGPVPSGEDAYADLLQQVRRVGIYRAPRFTDPLAERAMLGVYGSWRACCNAPENDQAGRARFLDFYQRLATQQRLDQASGIPLPEPKRAQLPARDGAVWHPMGAAPKRGNLLPAGSSLGNQGKE